MIEKDYMEVKVKEAYQEDSLRGIARISPDIMKKIGFVSGDVVEIEGKRKAVAIVWPDRGRESIRIDGIVRYNAGIGIDEMVKIRKIEPPYAKKIVIQPVQEGNPRGGPERFAQIIRGRPVVEGQIDRVDFMGYPLIYAISKVTPKSPVLLSNDTIIEYNNAIYQPEAGKSKDKTNIHYEDIGGLGRELQLVREMIELPLRRPEIFERLGIQPPKGVLLYGPPGTGKTLIAKAVANEVDAHFITLSGPEIMSKYYGESEKGLREKFEEAEQNAPSIIFIDEIDSIAPKREETKGEVERRIVAQLLSLMDGLKSRGQVIVIAATNLPDSIDPALRRGGRFDREIEIGIPDKKGRHEIFQVHVRGVPLADDVDLEEYANMTHGFVGADIALLVKEAAMHALRKVIPQIKIDEEIPTEVLEKLRVTKEDFAEARKYVEPSAMREVLVEVPDITWNQVGGLGDVKQDLKEAVEWPLKYPDVFARLQTKAPKGILLFGPPGTGKTLLAKAVANESECNFIAVKGPELLSKWVGESEKGVREIFRKARQAAPSIIFFDEIDALVPKRGAYGGSTHVTESVVSQILTELDGMEELKNVTILAATNRPDMLDDALLRPGRLERHIYVPAPDEESRKMIFDVYLGGETSNILSKDIDTYELVKKTEGYVGADIEAVVREAKMAAMRDFLVHMGSSSEQERTEAIKNVMLTKAHFDAALIIVKGSLDRDALERSEQQAWQMLYNMEQRKILGAASAAINHSAMLHKDADKAALANLRKTTYQFRKDFELIKKLTESLEGKKK
ncbi:MAG: CDC48 family AAA ATPase [Methanoregula sp.]|jgi:transitional endoplasmic reticulum ATPase|nr:CDC48 family AAA ATPase [Methanoregula sp.]